ncbi:protein singed wings 2 isoform X1 [Anopheles bellator]|uniref:protein singed wings 2 isoform X1 n=1 Tax=Anopheles bellator TaxID=139047 RepID=UPI0026476850|nr:protein singed wings 2 isoform X1 [Anopheles bellator]
MKLSGQTTSPLATHHRGNVPRRITSIISVVVINALVVVFTNVPIVTAQLPLSLQNLVVENVAIEECSTRPPLPNSIGVHRPVCQFAPPDSTVCFRGIDMKRIEAIGKANQTRQLILCDWAVRTFDPSVLTKLPRLERFALTGRSLQRLAHNFPPLAYLRMVNITGTRLNQTDADAFYDLEQLQVLNLRGNELEQIEQYRFRSGHVEIYLQGNLWNCTNDMIWLLRERSEQYVDGPSWVCKDWKYTGRPVLTAMEYKRVVQESCMHEEIWNCSCHVSFLRLSDNGMSFHPMIMVNCSDRGFYQLPQYLPGNTTVLHISGNKLDSVDSLTTNEHYQSVQDIYLDHNRITSIDILEDTVWLDHFRILSLRGNKLNRIRVYTVEHAIERNPSVGKLYLSNNPWRCGCRFAIRFQRFLRKHESLVADTRNITCYFIHDEDGSKQYLPVLTLTPNDICRESEHNTAAFYNSLSIVFASLIVLIFTKLAYDYYRYRKYGKLPWLIMKMP